MKIENRISINQIHKIKVVFEITFYIFGQKFTTFPQLQNKL